MKQLCVLIIVLLSNIVSGQDQWKNIYTENAWKDRDKWQRADDLIQLLRISSGSNVADIGCHEGYMSFKLATIVGDNGNVYAVDVERPKLEKLSKHIAERKVKNIEAVKGDYDDPRLPEHKIDAVIILDTYHEMDDHDKILQHIKASLKSGGRLLLCEPIADERRELSRSQQEAKHELAMKFAIDDLTRTGFKISYQKDPYIDRTKEKGDKMWVVLAVKQ